MEKIITKILRPQPFDVEQYKANDGKIFSNEEDCIKHEYHLRNIDELNEYFKLENCEDDNLIGLCNFTSGDTSFAVFINIYNSITKETIYKFNERFSNDWNEYNINKTGKWLIRLGIEEYENGNAYYYDAIHIDEIKDLINRMKNKYE